jgi:hypothetical protein
MTTMIAPAIPQHYLRVNDLDAEAMIYRLISHTWSTIPGRRR